ncbi:hypothetical protein K438DRAFT_1756176 [Mycena galopus ATCC 62051]|nr:hypothetical protein K438DRAFT_1756176 [Mycena galopus ATCC 62051]
MTYSSESLWSAGISFAVLARTSRLSRSLALCPRLDGPIFCNLALGVREKPTPDGQYGRLSLYDGLVTLPRPCRSHLGYTIEFGSRKARCWRGGRGVEDSGCAGRTILLSTASRDWRNAKKLNPVSETNITSNAATRMVQGTCPPMPSVESLQVLDAAHAAGRTFWDKADVYSDSDSANIIQLKAEAISRRLEVPAVRRRSGTSTTNYCQRIGAYFCTKNIC